MNYLVFAGTVRDSQPPGPARLGLRVAEFLYAQIDGQGDNQVELIDPLSISLEPVFKPHFAYASGKAPEALEKLAGQIARADAYIMTSPEYNHSMSPALANLLNHFGSSLFAYKPSLIVTYSAGQWGGARAAVNMRTFLSELGCLPVSAMVHIPKAQNVFDENGEILPGVDVEAWQSYIGRGLAQLEWWAQATASHRDLVDPHTVASAFRRDPSQRNAP